MTNDNVLIINGRSYDAITGQLLNSNDQPTPKARSIDGFSAATKSKTPAAELQNNKKQSFATPSRPAHDAKKTGRAHDIILSTSMHSSSSAKPLMRTGLKKPSKIVKPIKQLQTPIRLKQPTTAIKPRHSATSPQRVEGIHRSSQIKHFSQHHSPESPRWGVSSPAEPRALPTAKIIDSVTQQTSKLQNIIGRGLQKATSHDQPNPVHKGLKHKRKKTKLRIFNTVVASLAVLLILGFIVYKSIPDIDVRIASAKSGVHAEIPGYIPTGFRFVGPVKYGQGTVTVIFTSKIDSFRVVQQNSTWDSVGLRDNFVSTIDPNFKVVQAGGRIVYLYGQANATWVNGGIWYQITDNADLSTASLLKIVTSL